MSKIKFKQNEYVIEIYSKELHKVLDVFPKQLRVQNLRLGAKYTTDSADFIKQTHLKFIVNNNAGRDSVYW